MIKTKEEVGAYLRNVLKEQGLSQVGLAEEMLEITGEKFSKNNLTDNINKWLQGKRYPGTEFLFYLSHALKITIENILTCGEANEKYDDRVTLYAIAKDKKLNLVEKFFNQDIDLTDRYDEFDKTLFDYTIEFENIGLIKYMFDKGYLKFDTWCQDFHGMFSPDYDNEKKRSRAVLDMIIKDDELEYFKLMIDRQTLINKFFSYDALLSEDLLRKIINAPKILDYCIAVYRQIDKDWSNGSTTMFPREEYKNLPTLSRYFNQILKIAILDRNFALAEKMIDIGIKHNSKVAEFVDPADFYVVNDFCLQVRPALIYANITRLAGCDLPDIPDEIKEKVFALNEGALKCGKMFKKEE